MKEQEQKQLFDRQPVSAEAPVAVNESRPLLDKVKGAIGSLGLLFRKRSEATPAVFSDKLRVVIDAFQTGTAKISNLAETIRLSALPGITSLLPDKEAVEQKAQQLGSKAKKALQKTEDVGKGAGKIVAENGEKIGRFVAENSKSAGEFVLRNASMTSLRWGAREAAKGVWSISGIAGTVGGGIAGTTIGGAVVGAVAGAAVEYARQVNQNLDNLKIAHNSPIVDTLSIREAYSSENLTFEDRKFLFLRKIKGLKHAESWKPNDFNKLGKAAFFGAVTGAGAGTLVSAFNHKEEIASFLAERGITADKIGWLAGGVVKTATNIVAGTVGHFAADPELRIGITGQAAGEAGTQASNDYIELKLQNQIVGLTQQNLDLKESTAALRTQVEELARQNHGLNEEAENLRKQLAEARQAQLTPIAGPVSSSLTMMQDLNTLTITVPEGGNFWGSLDIPTNYFPSNQPEGWLNADNGVTQEEVVRGMVVDFAKTNGHNLNQIMPGTYSLKDVAGLTNEQESMIGKVLATRKVEDYFAIIGNI